MAAVAPEPNERLKKAVRKVTYVPSAGQWRVTERSEPKRVVKETKAPKKFYQSFAFYGLLTTVAGFATAVAYLSIDVFSWKPGGGGGGNQRLIAEAYGYTAALVDLGLAAVNNLWTPTQPARPPLIVAFSGGGMRAMTTSMAITKAMFQLEGGSAWPRVTHLSSVSGGTWFSSQLVYSARLYSSLADPSIGVDTTISDWGYEYASTVRPVAAA